MLVRRDELFDSALFFQTEGGAAVMVNVDVPGDFQLVSGEHCSNSRRPRNVRAKTVRPNSRSAPAIPV